MRHHIEITSEPIGMPSEPMGHTWGWRCECGDSEAGYESSALASVHGDGHMMLKQAWSSH